MNARLRSRWVPLAVLLTATACSGGGGSSQPTTTGTAAPPPTGGTVTIPLTLPFTSYNPNTPDTNTTSNTEVVNAVQPWVVKFDDHANLVVDPDLVTVTKTSDDPLIVDYAFNPAAVWSDGQPVGCDDVYLMWVADNGVVKDLATNTPIFQTFSTTGWDQIADVRCSGDGKTATVAYRSAFSDWKSLVAELLPAHVVAAHAGLASAAGIRTAYEGKDDAALHRIADFWNTGFLTEKGLDPTVLLSAGPYRISRIDAEDSVTLVRNEKYWGPRPPLDTIQFRTVTSEGVQAQALANHEVDVARILAPDADAVSQLMHIDGATLNLSAQYSFEHLDFNFQAPLFRDKAVRQAVADCVPRQEILDKLVKPVNGDAVLLQNRMFFPGQAGYADTSGGRYDHVDIAAAKATLEADGWKLDGGVYAKNGQRLEFGLLHKNVATRSAIAQLVQASCAAAGIAVDDDGDPTWTDRAGRGQFDLVSFAWIGSPLLSSQPSIYRTRVGVDNPGSNYGAYSNPDVDALMDVLATETDQQKLAEAANRADALLWDDVATIPLYQLPAAIAWTDHLHGVKPNPTYQGLTWNVETWTVS